MTTPYDILQTELKQTQKIVQEVKDGKRIGYYKLRGVLGKGAFSEVKLGLHCLLNEKVAVKIIEKGKHGCQTTVTMMRQEVSVMEKLSHPNIISLFEIIETLDKFYCIIEYVNGGCLFSYLKRKMKNMRSSITEDQARFFYIQIVDAVEHMHKMGVVHRDLKCENILLASDKTIRIADFGISALSTGLLKDFCGTPTHCPPELIQMKPYYGTFMDLWAMGVILYQLVDGLTPFAARDLPGIRTKILSMDYTIPKKFSPELKDFIEKIIIEEPSERMSIADMRKHCWLADAENEQLQKEGSHVYDDPVKSALAATGLPEAIVHEVVETGYQRGVEPKDSITGSYRIALHITQANYLFNQMRNKGPRFSIATGSISAGPGGGSLLNPTDLSKFRKNSVLLFEEEGDGEDGSSDDSEFEIDESSGKCCSVM